MVVLSAGKVVANGSTADILARLDLLPDAERDEAGALVDLELVAVDAGFGLSLLRSAGGDWRLPRLDAPVSAGCGRVSAPAT